jgi:hypothetical protein
METLLEKKFELFGHGEEWRLKVKRKLIKLADKGSLECSGFGVKCPGNGVPARCPHCNKLIFVTLYK